jgi:hypothetical protein
MQLWHRPNLEPKVQWVIEPAKPGDDCDEFYIRNNGLNRYAAAGIQGYDLGKQIRATAYNERETPGGGAPYNSGTRFNILVTDVPKRGTKYPCFVFIPVKAKNTVIDADGGGTGNHTKLVLGPIETKRPASALWRLTSA